MMPEGTLDHPLRRPTSTRSLLTTVVVAAVIVGVGWIAAWAASTSAQTVAGAGATFEIPSTWVLLEASPERTLASPSLGSDVRLVVSPVTDLDELTALARFVEQAPTRFVLFSLDETSDRSSMFRFVDVGTDGAPRELMAGRIEFVQGPGGVVSVTLFAPLRDMQEHLATMAEAVASLR